MCGSLGRAGDRNDARQRAFGCRKSGPGYMGGALQLSLHLPLRRACLGGWRSMAAADETPAPASCLCGSSSSGACRCFPLARRGTSWDSRWPCVTILGPALVVGGLWLPLTRRLLQLLSYAALLVAVLAAVSRWLGVELAGILGGLAVLSLGLLCGRRALKEEEESLSRVLLLRALAPVVV